MKLIYCDAEWIMVPVSISVLNLKEINLHPKKKKRGKKEKNQLDNSCLTPTPLLNSGLIYSSTLIEFALCLKTVCYKHI